MLEETLLLRPFFQIFLIYLFAVFCEILHNTDLILRHKMGSISHCGSVEYWLLYSSCFPIMFGITYILYKQNYVKYQRKLALEWIPNEHDLSFDKKFNNIFLYPFISLFAGVLAGGGAGGGLFLGPVLLELNMVPRVVAATVACCVILMSGSSVFCKILVGLLRMDYMAFFMFIGMISTFIGQVLTDYATKKYQRQSIVTFILFIVSLVAVVLLIYDTILDSNWHDMSLSDPCD